MIKYLLFILFGLQAYGAVSTVPETDSGTTAAAVTTAPVTVITPADVAAMGADSERYKMGGAGILSDTIKVETYGRRRAHSAGRLQSGDIRDRAHGVVEAYCAREGIRGFVTRALVADREGKIKDLRLRKALADEKRRYEKGLLLYKENEEKIKELEAALAVAKDDISALIALIEEQRRFIPASTKAAGEKG